MAASEYPSSFGIVMAYIVIGIFLLLRKCTVLLVADGAHAFWGSLYLDEHSEEDLGAPWTHLSLDPSTASPSTASPSTASPSTASPYYWQSLDVEPHGRRISSVLCLASINQMA